MWMGGNLPLGYDLPAEGRRALVVNEAEAATVRAIFQAYLELGSVSGLERWLAERGIASKARTTRDGRAIGGRPFNRGALFYLLRNRTYLGMIVHRDKVHPGMHPAIVEAELFEAVQARLAANRRQRAARRDRVARAPLTGRIFDADGNPMSPTFSYGRRKKRLPLLCLGAAAAGAAPAGRRRDDPAGSGAGARGAADRAAAPAAAVRLVRPARSVDARRDPRARGASAAAGSGCRKACTAACSTARNSRRIGRTRRSSGWCCRSGCSCTAAGR